MKLRLDNLVYTVEDPVEIDRLCDLGAVPFEEEQQGKGEPEKSKQEGVEDKGEPAESKQEEAEGKDEPENTEEKTKEARGRGKK